MSITAKVVIDVLDGNYTDTIHVYFPRSEAIPAELTSFGYLRNGAYLEDVKDSDGLYRGETKLKYQLEGCYVVITSKVELNQIEENAYSTAPCNMISIQSEQATNSICTNLAIIGLTNTMMGIALLTIRPVIHKFLGDYHLEN